MKKKSFVISALLIGFLTISTSFAFANTNVINTVEKTTQNVTATAENALNHGVGATKNTINNVNNGARRTGNTAITGTTNTRNDNRATNTYAARRTNTNTWLGMTSTAWTWLIMGIVAVAIVALVWFYARERNTRHSNE